MRDKQNILEVDYEGNIAFSIAIVTLLLAVFCAAPICVLPSKDSFEELVYAENGMGNKQNTMVTLGMVIGCYIFAVVIPGIGDALTILGSTTNPLVGFIFPIIFYLKLNPEIALWRKILAWTVMIFTSVVSIAGLVIFIIDKIKGT